MHLCSPQPGGADYLAKLHTAQEALVEESSPAMARVCVEILRAAGLKVSFTCFFPVAPCLTPTDLMFMPFSQRAVREASVWLGGGTGSLGRAIQVGPHSYARMSLFPADPELELSVPPLRTPFQV